MGETSVGAQASPAGERLRATKRGVGYLQYSRDTFLAEVKEHKGHKMVLFFLRLKT